MSATVRVFLCDPLFPASTPVEQSSFNVNNSGGDDATRALIKTTLEGMSYIVRDIADTPSGYVSYVYPLHPTTQQVGPNQTFGNVDVTGTLTIDALAGFGNRPVQVNNLGQLFATTQLAGALVDPDFGSQTVKGGDFDVAGNLVVSGNLTINGTTTTVNSTVVDVADRVIHLNAAAIASVPVPSQIVGIEVERGDNGATKRDGAAILWREGTSTWQFALNTTTDDTTVGADLAIKALGATFSGLGGSGAGLVGVSNTGLLSFESFAALAGSLTLTGDVNGLANANHVDTLTGTANLVTVAASTNLAFAGTPALSGRVRLTDGDQIKWRSAGVDRSAVNVTGSSVFFGDTAGTNYLGGGTTWGFNVAATGAISARNLSGDPFFHGTASVNNWKFVANSTATSAYLLFDPDNASPPTVGVIRFPNEGASTITVLAAKTSIDAPIIKYNSTATTLTFGDVNAWGIIMIGASVNVEASVAVEYDAPSHNFALFNGTIFAKLNGSGQAGTPVASTGTLRVAKDFTLYGMNSLSTLNMAIIRSDGVNNLFFGDGSVTGSATLQAATEVDILASSVIAIETPGNMYLDALTHHIRGSAHTEFASFTETGDILSVGRSTNFTTRLQPLIGSTTTNAALYMLASATSASGTNYTVTGDGTNSHWNTPGAGTHYWRIADTAVASLSTDELFRAGSSTHVQTRVGPWPTSPTVYGALYFLPYATASSGTNYSMIGDGTNTYVNAPGGAGHIYLLTANTTTIADFTTSAASINVPIVVDAASGGTLPSTGTGIRIPRYASATTIIAGNNTAGDAVILSQNNGSLTIGDANTTSGWNLNVNGYQVILNSYFTANFYSTSFFHFQSWTSLDALKIQPYADGSTNPQLLFGPALTSVVIKQATATSDVATATLSIFGQSAYATATGTNRNGATVVIAGGVKATGGVDGGVQLKVASTLAIEVKSFNSVLSFINSGADVGQIRSVSANYTIDATGPDRTVLVSADGKTITLPDATLWAGRRITVKSTSGNAGVSNLITFASTAGKLEGTAGNYTLNGGPYASLMWESDGTDWWIVNGWVA